MPTINQLASTDSVQAGDNLAVYIQNNGDARKAAMSVIQAYMQDNLIFMAPDSQQEYTKQYSAPSATAFDIQISDISNNVWLILTPTGSFANGAITLPSADNTVDKQEVLCNCTQAVTSFVVNSNGATAVTGVPTTLAANDFFKVKYDKATSTWYRVG